MDEGRELYELAKASETDARTKSMKATMDLSQRDYNKSVKNEDAEYKLIAYQANKLARGVGNDDS